MNKYGAFYRFAYDKEGRGKTTTTTKSRASPSVNTHYFHYFCVLFSSGSRQRGADDSIGLLGFLLPDILDEVKRGQKLHCGHCLKKGATLECAKCQMRYHYPCGRENGAYFVVFADMKTFCALHGPKNKAAQRIEEPTCLAGCLANIYSRERVVISPCCGRRYHSQCVQQMALQCGRAHFKCPVCSDQAKFPKYAILMGVYVPEQDASWERANEEDFYNFTAMGRLHQRCDVPVCECLKGREHHVAGTDFEIVRCSLCGSQGTHIRCGGLDKSCPDFQCPSHAEGQRTGKTVELSSIAVGGRLYDTGTTTEAPNILSERSESPKSTDSDDDHIVEAAIRKRLLRRSTEDEKSGESPRSSAPSSPIISSRSASPASLISSSSDDEPSVGSPEPAKSNSDDDIVVVREIPFNERTEAPSLGSKGEAPCDASQVTSPTRENPSSDATVPDASANEGVGVPRMCSPEHKKQRIMDREEVEIDLVDLMSSSESEADSENETNIITLD